LRFRNFFLAQVAISRFFGFVIATATMETDTNNTTRTLVQFDLAAELTPDELAKFQAAAEEAGAKNLTDHFLNLTIRRPECGPVRPAA
jgi:hypothetical protein